MTIFTVCWRDDSSEKRYVLIESPSAQEARLEAMNREKYIAQHPNCIIYIMPGIYK
jgi:hypothetical protein